MNEVFLAIINPAAGGGRCCELVAPALARLRSAGIAIETTETSAPGDAMRLARAGYQRGFRKFLAVGGDGTSYEIVNGLFPDCFFLSARAIPSCAISAIPRPPIMAWNTPCARLRRASRGHAMFCG